MCVFTSKSFDIFYISLHVCIDNCYGSKADKEYKYISHPAKAPLSQTQSMVDGNVVAATDPPSG